MEPEAAARSNCFADLPFAALGTFLDDSSLCSVRLTCRAAAAATAKANLQRMSLTSQDFKPIRPERYESVTRLELSEAVGPAGLRACAPPVAALLRIAAPAWTSLQVRSAPARLASRAPHGPSWLDQLAARTIVLLSMLTGSCPAAPADRGPPLLVWALPAPDAGQPGGCAAHAALPASQVRAGSAARGAGSFGWVQAPQHAGLDRRDHRR